MPKAWLYEYDRNVVFGPASDEMKAKFKAAQESGKPYFMYPYHGYELRMVVREVRSPDEERALYG